MIGRLIMYIVCLISLFVLACLFTNYAAYLALILAIIIPMLFGIIMFVLRIFISVDVAIDKNRVTKGDNVKVKFIVKNTGIFPVNNIKADVYIKYSSRRKRRKRVILDVMPMSTNVSILEIPAELSGCLFVCVKKITMTDYLGLFSIGFFGKKTAFNVFITPKVLKMNLKYRNVINDEFVDSTIYHPYKKGDDKSEIFGVREYVPGDQMKNIHWKLTAKQDKLMVKEFSKPVDVIADIICLFTKCDKNDDEARVIDKIIEIFYSMCYWMSEDKVAYNAHIISAQHSYTTSVIAQNEEDIYSIGDGIIASLVEKSEFEMSKKKNVADRLKLDNTPKNMSQVQYQKMTTKTIFVVTNEITDALLDMVSTAGIDRVWRFMFVTDNENNVMARIKELPDNAMYRFVKTKGEETDNIYEIEL